MSIEMAQLPESGNHLGRMTPFGSVIQYPTDPVECARLLWENGFCVIPFRMWNDGTKTHKMPLVKKWKPYTLKLKECLELVGKSGAFGIIVPSGYMVVDLDSNVNAQAEKARFAGLHNLLDMGEKHLDNLDFLNTLTVNTPSGGAHLWYRVPPGMTFSNSASQLAESIDIRVAGKGLILMPPSSVKDISYDFDLKLGAVDVARAPWWLLRELNQSKEKIAEERKAEAKRYNFNGSPENVTKYLAEKALQIEHAGVGMRNNLLNAVAYGIYKKVDEGHIPMEAAEDVIYHSALKTGLDSREVIATMKSARRAVGI